MEYIPDNYDMWSRHERDLEKSRSRLPKCAYCELPIQEEKCFRIDGELICEHCIKDFLKDNYEVWTEEYEE